MPIYIRDVFIVAIPLSVFSSLLAVALTAQSLKVISFQTKKIQLPAEVT